MRVGRPTAAQTVTIPHQKMGVKVRNTKLEGKKKKRKENQKRRNSRAFGKIREGANKKKKTGYR